MQILKDQRPLSTLLQNLTEDGQYMAFVQTADMLDLFKRNFKCGLLVLLVEARENPNKYNMSQLYITGIDIEIGNVLTFGIGLLSERKPYQVNWVLSKFFT